jgi:DNA (cytosine-5)-methyltransferase 1
MEQVATLDAHTGEKSRISRLQSSTGPGDRRQRLTAVDLFSGAGGLSLGAEMAGARVILASDIWSVAAQTYRTNHPSTVFVTQPVQELRAADILEAAGLKLGELDILLGGPPCQGFSIYAPKRRLDDERNSLIFHYLRLVEGIKPKCLVMENVPGLLSLGGGRVMEAVCDRLWHIGYVAEYRVLLAAWYGVPQERWRLVIIGRRRDMPQIGFPPPEYWADAGANFTDGAKWARLGADSAKDTARLPSPPCVEEAIGDLPPLANGEGQDRVPMPPPPSGVLSDYQAWARAGARELLHHVAPRLSQINLKRLRYIKPGGNWTGIPRPLLPAGMRRARKSDHTKRYGRLDPGGLSCTILTKCDPHWGSFFHYGQDRAITPREAARLQSFPDWYVFCGSAAAKYEQIGNAVPPLLAMAVVGEICRVLAPESTVILNRDIPGARRLHE